ncbi:hypothetical protein ACILE2_10935 [Capnocytophaga canimorsus]|uniref:hypothetical protein n=1 Tax=Capnocytophaga canimorsus TaxID=28188 RepID=UPI0037D0AAA0
MTKDKKTKEDYLAQLAQLDEITLKRLAELSKNEKARSYFSNPIKYNQMKLFLKMM